MKKRLLLTLVISIIASLAAAAAAHAAAGTVTVYDGGDYKSIDYTGSADANEVTIGGDNALHTITITEVGIADPGPAADPGNICSLTAANTLTCLDPKLGAKGWWGGYVKGAQGADVVTIRGTQRTFAQGDEGEDRLTGSDEMVDHIEGGPGNDTLDARGGGSDGYPDRVDGNDGNDVLRGGTGEDELNGGAGNDEIYGDDGSDWLNGDADVDALHGGAGDDFVSAGPGDGELLDGGDGSDDLLCHGEAGETYDGGPGLDLIACVGAIDEDAGPVDYLIDLTAGVVNRINGSPTTSTVSSVEDAEARGGNDVLIGTNGSNALRGGAGNDSIDGRGGSDHISAQSGNDTIETADGAADRADAGEGTDSCHGDVLDDVFACEALTLAPTPSGSSGDRTAPHVKVISARGSRRKGQIVLQVTSDEAARLGADAVARLKRVPRGVIASRVGDVTLGSTVKKVVANAKVRLTVRISKRYRHALRRGGRIRMVLRATDALGNASSVSRTVRMR